MAKTNSQRPIVSHVEIAYHPHRLTQSFTLWERGRHACRPGPYYALYPGYSAVVRFASNEDDARRWINQQPRYRGLPVVLTECENGCRGIGGGRRLRVRIVEQVGSL